MNSTMSLPIPTPTPSSGGTTFSSSPSLTSTTAPGKIFTSRSELQSHYKSDWHRYNLKRREAGLSMLNEIDFNLRLEAAVALRKEREGREERSGVDHRKDKGDKKNKKKKNKQQQQGKGRKRQPAFAKRDEQQNNAVINEEEENEEDTTETMQVEENEESANDSTSEAMDDEEEPPEINPSQSLFDNHISPNPQLNLTYLQNHYSFYLPDAEYCVDIEGFLGYCNEKVRWGNICLYCQKPFKSTEGVLKHMRDKRHCMIRYERGVDMEEFDVFYDFSDQVTTDDVGESEAMEDTNGAGDDEEWEDVDDEDEEGQWEDASMKDEDEDDDDDLYSAYQNEIASQGFDITPLGELIFPDGRIVGHRGLARYYKQRFAPDRMERAAVRHAREAAGDRLYGGRVVNLYQLQQQQQQEGESQDNTNGEGGGTSTALATMGRLAGSIPTGRNGKGILVSAGGEAGKGGFTSLSLYRYRAAIKKQRREDARGQRLEYRAKMNMNKMNKKGNVKMTGVVTALAPR